MRRIHPERKCCLRMLYAARLFLFTNIHIHICMCIIYVSRCLLLFPFSFIGSGLYTGEAHDQAPPPSVFIKDHHRIKREEDIPPVIFNHYHMLILTHMYRSYNITSKIQFFLRVSIKNVVPQIAKRTGKMVIL